MDEFAILLNEVRKAADGIQATVAGMDELGVDRIVGPEAQYGHSGVHAALSEFGDRWQYGISVLVEDVDALSDGLRSAVETYAETENANTAAIQRTGQPLDGGR